VNVPKGADVKLADGPGKEVVEGGCALCHGLDRAVAARRSEREWHKIVDRMIAIGAPLDAALAKRAGDYLASHYGPEKKASAAP
jgi:mono/diheme cytochrome c family protein